MRIPICLSGERTTSMHFVKVRGARDSPEGPCIDMPLPPRQISRIICGGGLSASFRSSEKNPGHTCERICFNVIILNGRLMRARFRCLRSRMGLRQPSFGDEEVMAVEA